MWFPLVLAATAAWAGISVIDSSLVKRYEKHPLILLWSQSLFTVPALILLFLLIDVHTAWWPMLMLAGMAAYLGDIYFFLILERVDASISSLAWAILTILLSIAGFLLFDEAWSFNQGLGAALVLGGALLLPLQRSRLITFRSLALLTGLAIFYVPVSLAKKASMAAGLSIEPVFFWLLIGRELLSFSGVWFVPSLRRRVKTLNTRVGPHFYLMAASVIGLFFLGEYFGTLSYRTGQLSLVSIVGNIQPFIVMILGWLCHRHTPSFTPKELLDADSVRAKLLSFMLVFLGLALLAVSQ